MTWLSLRLLRTPITVAAALTVVACAVLAFTGYDLADRAHGQPNLYSVLTNTDRFILDSTTVVLAVAPALLGLFWGAPMIARELETGTYRLAWSQSVTRRHWLAARLGTALVAVIIVVGLLSLAVNLWAAPIEAASGNQLDTVGSRVTPVAFAMRGVVPVAYAVFAVVCGAFLGLAVRRTVPAMALTLLVYVLIQVAVPLWVRPHLIAPVTTKQTASVTNLAELTYLQSGDLEIATRPDQPRSWILDNYTVDAEGRPTSPPAWFSTCMPGMDTTTSTVSDEEACFERLDSEGYHQRLVFHPPSHFWPLQFAETGLYLALTAVLTALTFWWIRRRVA